MKIIFLPASDESQDWQSAEAEVVIPNGNVESAVNVLSNGLAAKTLEIIRAAWSERCKSGGNWMIAIMEGWFLNPIIIPYSDGSKRYHYQTTYVVIPEVQ